MKINHHVVSFLDIYLEYISLARGCQNTHLSKNHRGRLSAHTCAARSRNQDVFMKPPKAFILQKLKVCGNTILLTATLKMSKKN